MDIKLPIKTLIRLNCLVSLIISVYSFLLLLLLKQENQTYGLWYALVTFVVISVIGFANIYIVIRLSRIGGLQSRNFKKYRYILSYLASALAYFLIWPFFSLDAVGKVAYGKSYNLLVILISSAMVNTLIIVLQDLVLLQNEKAQADIELSRLKNAHSEAANLLLKQQIQPHFLFNALNTLKSLYRVNANVGDTYIVHLANFLRASIFIHDANVSKLGDELKVLNDYFEMQKIRFGTALSCTIEIPEDSLNRFFLPSFSLQPLLENAIKHNELTEEMPLEVTITQIADRIVVQNNFQKKRNREISTNSGLANLAERYKLWSGDEVIIKETPEYFSVSIKLLKHEHSNH